MNCFQKATAVAALAAGCATGVGLRANAQTAGSLNNAPSADLYLGVVQGLIGQERYRAALAFLDQYAVTEEKSPRYLLLRGQAQLGAKDYANAVATFSMLQGTALDAEGYDGEGRAEAGAGHWEAARVHFAQAAAARPSSAAFLNNLGYAELRLNQPDAAAVFRQARELAPQDSRIRNNLILSLSRTGDAVAADAVLGDIAQGPERAAVARFVTGWNAEASPDTQNEVVK